MYSFLKAFLVLMKILETLTVSHHSYTALLPQNSLQLHIKYYLQ